MSREENDKRANDENAVANGTAGTNGYHLSSTITKETTKTVSTMETAQTTAETPTGDNNNNNKTTEALTTATAAQTNKPSPGKRRKRLLAAKQAFDKSHGPSSVFRMKRKKCKLIEPHSVQVCGKTLSRGEHSFWSHIPVCYSLSLTHTLLPSNFGKTAAVARKSVGGGRGGGVPDPIAKEDPPRQSPREQPQQSNVCAGRRKSTTPISAGTTVKKKLPPESSSAAETKKKPRSTMRTPRVANTDWRKTSPSSQDTSSNSKKSRQATTSGTTSARRPKAEQVFEGRPDDSNVDWPEGWIKRVFERQSGSSKGHLDRYWYSPQKQKKLRSLVEVRKFLRGLTEYGGDEDKAFLAVKGKLPLPL